MEKNKEFLSLYGAFCFTTFGTCEMSYYVSKGDQVIAIFLSDTFYFSCIHPFKETDLSENELLELKEAMRYIRQKDSLLTASQING